MTPLFAPWVPSLCFLGCVAKVSEPQGQAQAVPHRLGEEAETTEGAATTTLSVSFIFKQKEPTKHIYKTSVFVFFFLSFSFTVALHKSTLLTHTQHAPVDSVLGLIWKSNQPTLWRKAGSGWPGKMR